VHLTSTNFRICRQWLGTNISRILHSWTVWRSGIPRC